MDALPDSDDELYNVMQDKNAKSCLSGWVAFLATSSASLACMPVPVGMVNAACAMGAGLAAGFFYWRKWVAPCSRGQAEEYVREAMGQEPREMNYDDIRRHVRQLRVASRCLAHCQGEEGEYASRLRERLVTVRDWRWFQESFGC